MAIDNSRIISTVKILLAKGIDGVGIESIEKTGTSGLVDTYTITYTDSRKTTFTITNGNGIASVEKTSTSGLVDTYTITFDDGSTETFDITNGRGITKIEKTATVGNVDTYTITYNDGTTSTYEVTNGAGSTASGIIFTDNGEGATNVQDAVDNTLKLIAPIQLTLTADKTYNVGDQFVYEGLLYEVTATIASGTAITIGSNCQLTDTVAEQLSEINSNFSYQVLETAPANTTYASQLSTLKAKWDTLNDDVKRQCSILRGGAIYRQFATAGEFTRLSVSNNDTVIESCSLGSTQYWYNNTLRSGGSNSWESIMTYNDTQTLSLVINL